MPTVAREPLQRFIRAPDVQAQLGCSRSYAYEKLRKCALRLGRQAGKRALLAVPCSVWEEFIAEQLFPRGSPDAHPAPPTRRQGSTPAATQSVVGPTRSAPPIRVTKTRLPR